MTYISKQVFQATPSNVQGFEGMLQVTPIKRSSLTMLPSLLACISRETAYKIDLYCAASVTGHGACAT